VSVFSSHFTPLGLPSDTIGALVKGIAIRLVRSRAGKSISQIALPLSLKVEADGSQGTMTAARLDD